VVNTLHHVYVKHCPLSEVGVMCKTFWKSFVLSLDGWLSLINSTAFKSLRTLNGTPESVSYMHIIPCEWELKYRGENCRILQIEHKCNIEMEKSLIRISKNKEVLGSKLGLHASCPGSFSCFLSFSRHAGILSQIWPLHLATILSFIAI
jgi:hypothetical protein